MKNAFACFLWMLLLLVQTGCKQPGALDVGDSLDKAAATAELAWTEETTGMEFVWVPGGCFKMGSRSGDEDEKPVHKVCVSGFWIGKYEVTQAEWVKVMKTNPSVFRGDRLPVDSVSWDYAQEFISALSSNGTGTFRLPTEAEWEYAARSGGMAEKYAGGSSVDRLGWHTGNSAATTHPVGTRKPNGLGLHDMSGNVWEWCLDRYGKHAYVTHAATDPVYSGEGELRLHRGGSWCNAAWCLRTTYRLGFDPAEGYDDHGLRLVRMR